MERDAETSASTAWARKVKQFALDDAVDTIVILLHARIA